MRILGQLKSNQYLITLDIGNTNTVMGVFSPESRETIFHRRTVTRRDRTSDELGLFFRAFLKEENIDSSKICHAIYSSVVPSVNPIVERMLEDWFNVKPICVNYKMNLPFTIVYPRPFEIGADRLVNTAAAVELYPGNKIVVDLGTATTFCVVNANREYLGGVIAPGLKISMEALSSKTAQLPPIIFKAPGQIIGSSTVEAIQAGFFYGWVGMLERIILEIRQSKGQSYKVIGTGGLINIIHKECPDILDYVDPMLTLKGLEILFRSNQQDF